MISFGGVLTNLCQLDGVVTNLMSEFVDELFTRELGIATVL